MTQKQEELLNGFLVQLSETDAELYSRTAHIMCELGYSPKRERSAIVFKHTLHNKQLAKFAIDKSGKPVFALRFSGCKSYPEKFSAAVITAITKQPARTPRCPTGDCYYCKGEPLTHVYRVIFPDGTEKRHCGAYAIEIPDITASDLPDIIGMTKEEHAYLLSNECGD